MDQSESFTAERLNQNSIGPHNIFTLVRQHPGIRPILEVVIPAIVADAILFCVMVLALSLLSVGANFLHMTGYDPARLNTFETIHFWCYSALSLVFSVDLIYKTILALFCRDTPRARQ